jgi:hypothetical protein
MSPAPIRAFAVALVALVVTAACGHKGPPRPPLRRTPPGLTDFKLAQRGETLEVSLIAPRASVDGLALEGLDVEIFWGEGQVDLEKAGRRRRVRADAGARVVESLPLPPRGTLVRAAARAIAGGAEGQRTVIRSLEVQPPLSPPHQLAVELRVDGVSLEWQGELPEPVEAPETRPAGGRLPFSAPPEEGRLPFGTDPEEGPSAEEERDVSGTPSEAGDEEVPADEEPLPGAESAEDLDPGPRIHGFGVYRRTPPGVYRRPLNPEPREERTFIDRAAPLGAEACYVVRAVASVEPLIESASSNEVCLDVRDIVAPSAPTGLAVVPRQGGLEIVWTPSPESDLSGYRVYRVVGGAQGGAELVGEVEAGTTSFIDADASPEVLHRYKVIAVDKAGNESPPSDEAEGRRP